MLATSDTVYLVSCVSQKKEQECAARDLYISSWFRKARRYVEVTGCPWFILSAEYGLVMPDRAMKASDRRAWAERVAQQLEENVPDLKRAVFLAGQRYREFLANYLIRRGVAVGAPMEGLRIGEQLGWLSKQSLSSSRKT
jgi:hypothetical protein